MAARRVSVNLALLAIGMGSFGAAESGAHDFTITNVAVAFKSDGSFQIDMTCDLDALATGAPPQHSASEVAAALRALPPGELEEKLDGLRALFRRRVRVRFDSRAVEPRIEFPELGRNAEHSENSSVLGTTARLSGSVPDAAREFTFWASRAFRSVHLSVTRGGGDPEFKSVLGDGEESRPYPLHGDAPPPSRLAIAWQYACLGFQHIVPEGADHILFVLGLFLLGSRLRPLLWQVTAFTAAHSVTLGLAMYGVLRLSPQIVEPLIALSIAYVAVENILTSELKPWRPVIVFGFGLLHGLGFAGVLTELGLPREEFATGLVSFNVGVEMGQLAVILAALALVGWCRKKSWYRAGIVVPASLVIAAVGLYWAIERAFFA